MVQQKEKAKTKQKLTRLMIFLTISINRLSLQNCLCVEIFFAPITFMLQIHGLSTKWGTVHLEKTVVFN